MSSEEDSEFPLYSDKLLKKPKRTRQRVDAGEPRNSYSSIPNFSSRPNFFPNSTNYYSNYFVHPSATHHHHQQQQQQPQQHSQTHQFQQQQQQQHQQYFNLFCAQSYTTSVPTIPQSAVPNSILAPKMLNELLCNRPPPPPTKATNNIMQTVQQTLPMMDHTNGDSSNNNNNNNNNKYDCNSIVNDNQVNNRTNSSPISSPTQALSLVSNQDFANHMLRDILQNRKHDLINLEHEFRNNNHLTNNNNNEEIAKHDDQTSSQQQNDSVNEIVEDIILNNSMLSPKIDTPISPAKSDNVKKTCTETDNGQESQQKPQPQSQSQSQSQPVVNGCKKRKLYQPQQHADKFLRLNDDEDDISDECDDDDGNHENNESLDEEDDEEGLDFEQLKMKKLEKNVLKSQLRTMQEQLVDMQQKYVQLCTKIDKEKDDENIDDQNQSGDEKNSISNENSPSEVPQQSPLQQIEGSRLNGLFHHNSQNSMAAAAAAMYLGHKLFFDQEAKLQMSKEIVEEKHQKTPSQEKNAYLLELENLADTLKHEISSSLSNMIDSILSRYLNQKRLNNKIDDNEITTDNHHNNVVFDRKSPKNNIHPISKPINGSFQGMLHSLKAHHHNQQQQQQQHHLQQQELSTHHLRPNLPFLQNNKPQPLINSAAAAAAALYAMNQHNMCFQQKHTVTPSTTTASSVSQTTFLDQRNTDVLEQNEALSLVMTPKKKRHKVTDTRITPRTVSRILAQDNLNVDHNGSTSTNGCSSPRSTSIYHPGQQHHSIVLPTTSSTSVASSILQSSLPTSVAIPNPQLHESQVFSPYSPFFHNHNMSIKTSSSPPRIKNEPDTSPIHHPPTLLHPALLAAAHHRASPDYNHLRTNSNLLDNYDRNSDCNSTDLNFDGAHSSTLTPMHLRKAKLMFFWVRYPSSSVLKMYFPDIKFNKNNTAQLVKWFSNFREFYYIQMEKYARQAVSEGIKNVEDINVATDSEIYRVLNLHYNRNNHIEVPSNFRFVVEQTLREFFKAISTGKDTEQSWKKSIYKVISRLDDSVPEYFKSPNFLEQLE